MSEPGSPQPPIPAELVAGAFDSLSLGANIIDEHGMVLYTNEAQAQILGTTVHALVGQSIAVHLNLKGNSADEQLAAFLQRMRNGDLIHEFMGAKRDGSSFSSRIWSRRIRRPYERMFTLMQRDISRETSAEEELVKTREELTDFIESARIGLHWVGPDGTILWANRSELEMLGFPKDEYIGRNISEFHADLPVIEDILRRLTCDETIRDYPARLRCKDGNIRDVLIDSSVYRKDGHFIHTRCFTRDVTEQRRAEADLSLTLNKLADARDAALDANRAKSEFLANMSHELRTPLNAIIGYAEMLYDDEVASGNEVQASDLKYIVNAGQHLKAIIGDILDLSRIEAGKLEMHMCHVNISQCVDEAINLAEPLAQINNNQVRRDFCPDSFYVLADHTRLRQILFNLVSNAVKFTSNGIITVRCRELDTIPRQFQIEVEDSGSGISEQELSLLFQPFVRLHNDASIRAGGTGLGLVICKRLAEMMRATISVQSTMGRGSIFGVCLPAVDIHKHVQKG